MQEALGCGWDPRVNEASSTLQRTSSLTLGLTVPGPGSCLLLCFPSLSSSQLVPLGVTGIPKVLPPPSHLLWKGRSPLQKSSRVASPGHRVLHFAVFLAFAHLIFSPVGEFHKTCDVAVAWLPAALCV